MTEEIYKEDDHVFYYETAHFKGESKEERENAVQYLKLWKFFLMRKFGLENYNFELIDEQWINREALYSGPLALYDFMSLKLRFNNRSAHTGSLTIVGKPPKFLNESFEAYVKDINDS